MINESTKRLYIWIGSISLLLIIPVKAVRFLDKGMANTFLVGIAPSFLGPIGLLFFVLSSSRLTLAQATLLVAVVALALEFVQLIPRSGVFARVHYTFDWFDILASLIGVLVGYLVALVLSKKNVS